jgi:hypothetical protein
MEKPKTLEECYDFFDKIEDINDFIKMSEDSAIPMIHFTFGMWVRNNFGLWTGGELKDYFESLGIQHPDDMSGIILTSYHRLKNNKPIQLEDQVEHYIEYWLDDKQKLLRQRKRKLNKINEIQKG